MTWRYTPGKRFLRYEGEKETIAEKLWGPYRRFDPETSSVDTRDERSHSRHSL